MRYAFWNNKGGTGKTSLIFQTSTEYAIQNPDKKILIVDLCPQANLSELLMGGELGNGGGNLDKLYNDQPARSIGGYFQDRFKHPYSAPQIDYQNYISSPSCSNSNIPKNIDLIAGHSIVELQANSISSLSNQRVPQIDTYFKVIDWLNDLIDVANKDNTYTHIFIDTNPSFSIYTQIAIAAAERLVVPVMADDSSKRALKNVFSLVYGLDMGSLAGQTDTFHEKMKVFSRHLPKIHLIVKNRLTQYMGTASAYAGVLKSINIEVEQKINSNPDCFTFTDVDCGVVNIRDFQTTGVVAFTEATPFSSLKPGLHNRLPSAPQVQKEYLDKCKEAIQQIVKKMD